MKQSITFVMILVACCAIAQIPNAGFENWSGGKPVGWFVSNFGSATPITQVNNAHSGSSAMKMEYLQSFQTGGAARCPDNPDKYFPYADRPFALSGWMISSFSGSDNLNVSCMLSKNGNIIGFAATNFTTVSSVYKQFVAPITYSVAGNADSARVDLVLFGTGFALVDDLKFETNGTGINSLDSDNIKMLQLISDPANNESRIEYQNNKPGNVKLQFFDLGGKCIRTLLDQYQDSGRYRIYESLDAMPEGVYFLRFETAEEMRTQKFCVIK